MNWILKCPNCGHKNIDIQFCRKCKIDYMIKIRYFNFPLKIINKSPLRVESK